MIGRIVAYVCILEKEGDENDQKKVVSVLIVLIVAGAVYYLFWGNPWKAHLMKQEFENYLSEKYDESFVLGKIEIDFMHRVYSTYAYSEARPDVRFYVGYNPHTGVLEDAYLYELNKQSTKNSTLYSAHLTHIS